MSDVANAVVGTREGCILTVHVVPRASRTELAGMHGDALRVRVQAPPVAGEANAVLLAYLAARLGVRQEALTLLSGAAARRKRVAIRGLSPAVLGARLQHRQEE